MALASTSVLVPERAPPHGCHQFLCPQSDLHLPAASLGDSPRSAGGSDPGSYPITDSALGIRVCESLCASFKSGIPISYAPWLS